MSSRSSILSLGLISLTLGACAALDLPTGGDDGGGGGGGGESPCTVGNLFAGDPLYNGDATPSPSGTPLRADPPLAWRDAVVDGARVFTHTGQEIWGGDRSGVHRIVGARQDGLAQFRAGACADARLAYTDGIAILPDGSLIVADFNANAVVKITDPMGPGCAMSYYAGTAEALATVSPGSPPNVGDADGTGGAARFALPLKPVTDGHGTVYLLDHGNGAIRKITPAGAVGMVSTVPFSFTEDDVEWEDLAMRGGKLIVIGNSFGASSYVVEVDPGSGAYQILIGGDATLFPPADPGSNVVLASVVSDGSRVFVSGSGRIWQIADGGEAIHAAGGYGPSELIDFPFAGYDPAAEHDALDIALKSIGDAQSSQFMTFDGDSLYFAARGTGTGAYVLDISCPR